MDDKNYKPTVVPSDDDFELDVFEDDMVRPYGYDPYKGTQTAKKAKLEITGITRNDKDEPVYVVNSLVTPNGQPVDLEGQFYNGYGEEVDLLLDDSNRLIVKDAIYTADRKRVYPEIKLYPYFVDEEIVRQDGEALKSMIEPEDILETGKPSFMLEDKFGRPVYPLGGARGFIVDANKRPVYPKLKDNGSYYTMAYKGRPRQEVYPTTINVFAKDTGMPIYPYNNENNMALNENKEESEEPVVPVAPYMSNMEPEQDIYNRNSEEDLYSRNSKPQQPMEDDRVYLDTNYEQGYLRDEQEEPSSNNFEKEPNEPETPWYKDPKMIGIVIGIVVLILAGIFGWNKFFGGPKDNFKLENKEVTMELDKKMKLDLEEFFGKNMSEEALEEVEVETDGHLNYNKNTHEITTRGKKGIEPGTYTLKFKYKKEEGKAVLNIEDTVAPVIDGSDTVTFAMGKYSDNGLIGKYTIEDASEVKVSVDTFQQNLSKEGTYKADITAVDTSNNKTTKSVTINVQKTAQQKEQEAEAKKKAEEEAKRKAEEEARLKAEEEARRKAEEEAKKACVPSLPTGAYTNQTEAYSNLIQMKAGMMETPFPLQDGQALVVSEYRSNCDTPYWLIEAR